MQRIYQNRWFAEKRREKRKGQAAGAWPDEAKTSKLVL
jgi:hypothetical protein